MKKNFEKKLTTKELEAFVNKQEGLESKSGRDNIIIWSLLFMGIAGLFMVFQSNDHLFNNTKSEQISEEEFPTLSLIHI